MKLEELSRILRTVDPAAVLVPETALARVVQAVTGVTWAIWYVPHSHCLAIDRFTLFKHVEPDELYLPADQHLPETVLLLERPTADQLASSRGDNSALLGKYWRLLFHVSVHRELEKRLAEIPPALLRERIERIGTAAFEEARSVLTHDGHLVSGADDKAAYVEFAAFFLELKFFAANLTSVYFPSLPSVPEVDAVLATDLPPVPGPDLKPGMSGAEQLYNRTRLPKALDPTPKTDDQSDESEDYYRRLTQSAERAASSGDIVAAAIFHTRAARVAPATKTRPAQALARQAIYDLVTRLQGTLGLTEPAVQEAWREVLPTLLDKADQGARPVEAALLYDLQRACLDAEQTIYTLNVFEWGRRPIRRPLNNLQYVRVPTHLRSAIRRLAAARLTDADRQALGGLLRDALARAEDRLRDQFRPVLTTALRDAGLQPKSIPEHAALNKTVEELLDRISSAGYLGFADVRDAIARGQMKLDDLVGPHEYVRGDPLLRLDRRLTTMLDGVYRGAESYTRGLERLTAIGFGTKFGRWFTRNVTLPFGGAVLGAEFVWLLAYERLKEVAKRAEEPIPSFFDGWNASWEFHLAWFTLGLFFLAVICSSRVRSVLRTTARGGYQVLRTILWDFPLQVWSNPVVRALVASLPAQIVINYAVRPLVLCLILWHLFFPELWGVGWSLRIIALRLLTLVAMGFLVNSRIGRVGDLLLLEAARGIINVMRSSPAVIRWLNDLFKEMVDALEWVLARTEDWLRLRGQSGPMAVAVRAVAGVIWMPFAFLIRFYTVVLIEPMVNPLKLPLCLLFAKFVYPLLAVLQLFTFENGEPTSPLVEPLANYVPHYLAWLIVVGTFWLSPDLVTYLFWEMHENWRLYRANHPDGLNPVAVGPHGESIMGLLHPSFHSGTVPRLYARLRNAELEAARTDVWRDARTYRQALRGVEEAVSRFVMHNLVAVVNASPAWEERKLSVGVVCLGTNRIRVQLTLEGMLSPAWLEWEDRSGWLVAGCAEAGFLAKLPPGPRRVLENALAYLYKRAGVDLVREQVKTALPKEAVHFDFAPGGLLVWYGTREGNPVLYDPDDPVEELRPRSESDRRQIAGPTLDAERVVFARLKLTWGQWLAVWQPQPAGAPEPRFGPTTWELSLLPPPVAPPSEDDPPTELPTSVPPAGG